jgi:hypothetical protein
MKSLLTLFAALTLILFSAHAYEEDDWGGDEYFEPAVYDEDAGGDYGMSEPMRPGMHHGQPKRFQEADAYESYDGFDDGYAEPYDAYDDGHGADSYGDADYYY